MDTATPTPTPTPTPTAGAPAPATPTLAVDTRMLRSPSRESVTTELSMLSVSSQASADPSLARIRLLGFHPARSVSPNPDSDKSLINRGLGTGIPEVEWCDNDEENDVIRSCAALSAMLGLQKSFSTSDIAQMPGPAEGLLGTAGTGAGATPLGPLPMGPLGDAFSPGSLRTAVSELTLSPAQKNSYLLCQSRLENNSRSCSTWVAVGDAANSQLPSPHGHAGHPAAPGPGTVAHHLVSISPADLVRSVNKKVRQNYIRRKLLTTYKALERFSLSKCNLDTLGVAAAAAAAAASASRGSRGGETPTPSQAGAFLAVPGAQAGSSGAGGTARSFPQTGLNTILKAVNKSKTLTVGDVERERGKPLSKYDRNIMIFNWLHQLEPEECECFGEPL